MFADFGYDKDTTNILVAFWYVTIFCKPATRLSRTKPKAFSTGVLTAWSPSNLCKKKADNEIQIVWYN